MIRIDLLHKKQRRTQPVLLFLVVAAAMAGAGLVGLYWIDQHYPLVGVWNEFWASEDAGETKGIGIVPTVPVEVEDESVVVEESVALTGETQGEEEPIALMGETAVVDVEVAALPAEESAKEDTAFLRKAETASEQSLGGHRQQPRWSAACVWAIELAERMPSNARLTSLACNVSGEYTLEGQSASHKVAKGFLKTLQQLPSRVSLSWWREGKLRAEQAYRYKFTFQGQFGELYSHDLEELSGDQAGALFKKVGAWALQSGLGGLSLKELLEIPLTPERMQQRQKLWATGSYQQISAFLKHFKHVEDIACLGEVVMVPIYQEGESWQKARLYAAIDVLVRRP